MTRSALPLIVMLLTLMVLVTPGLTERQTSCAR